MSGQSRWVYEGGELHASLLAEGWEQSPHPRMEHHVFGSGVYVYMTKTDTQAETDEGRWL